MAGPSLRTLRRISPFSRVRRTWICPPGVQWRRALEARFSTASRSLSRSPPMVQGGRSSSSVRSFRASWRERGDQTARTRSPRSKVSRRSGSPRSRRLSSSSCPTRAAMRSLSSSTISRYCARLSGAMSSRRASAWPRSTASGVFSSWAAARVKSRCRWRACRCLWSV